MEFNTSRALESEQKKINFYTGFWKGFTGPVANWLLEKPGISGVSSSKRNNDRKASSVVVICLLQRVVYDQME